MDIFRAQALPASSSTLAPSCRPLRRRLAGAVAALVPSVRSCLHDLKHSPVRATQI